MAANACTAPSSYSTSPSLTRSSSLQNNQQLCNLSYKSQNVQIGVSFDYKKGFGIWKPTTSPSSLRVSCLQNTKVTAVTTKSWEKLILSSDTPVLVEFHATWCGPCRMVHRVIDDIAAEYSGRLKCYLLDADRELQVAEDYDIKAVPVVLLFKNGEKCDTIIGTMPKEFYVAAIEKLLVS